MQSELDREAPRLHAATGAVSYLQQLTTVGFGETPAQYTLRNPAWNVAWVALFLLILWLLYRLRARSLSKE